MTLREQVKAAIEAAMERNDDPERDDVDVAADGVMYLIGPLVELARDLDVWTSATSSWTLSDLTLAAGEILDTLGVERRPPPFG